MTPMNALNMRDISRPKLTPRYGAARPQRANRYRPDTGHMPAAELRSLVAAMVD